MNFEQQATRVCEKKGLLVLGFDCGWVFVQDGNKKYGISEHTVAKWIKDHSSKNINKRYQLLQKEYQRLFLKSQEYIKKSDETADYLMNVIVELNNQNDELKEIIV